MVLKSLRFKKMIFIVIIIFFVIAIVGLNIFFRICIPYFYKTCKAESDIPGLNDGFTPQGLSYIPKDDIFLTCGYMKNGSASRIYIFNSEKSDYVLLSTVNGEKDTTHAGGIAYWNDYIFMAHDNIIAVYKWEEIKTSAVEHSNITPIASFEIGFESAFCYVYKDTLYVGEFYRKGKYDTPESHHLITDNGDNHHAIICTYDLNQIQESNFSKGIPLYAYSIPDLVQGICISDIGDIYISTSWGIAFSHIYVYKNPNIEKIDCNIEIENINVPIYYLDSYHMVKDIKIIPMCEELYYRDGSIFFINESASNKYKFGKFMFGSKIYSLKVN